MLTQEQCIEGWNRSAINTRILIRAFREELRLIAKAHTGDAGTAYLLSRLKDVLKATHPKFESGQQFLQWAAAAMESLHVPTAPKLPPRAWLPRSPTSSESDVVGYRPLIDPLRPEADHEPTDLALSYHQLAETIDKATDAEFPLIRLLSLRVVGGWSLLEIAKRDGTTLEKAAEAWAAARRWVESRSQRAAAVATIQTFDLLDLRVIETILSDRKLASSLDWRAFERMLAAILETMEYEIELQRGTKDGGIDIIAVKKNTPFGAHRYLLQAKRWAQRVGVEAVRELLFLQQHVGATKACLATTSTFTEGAWRLADEYRWQMELRDFEKLQEWVRVLRATSLGGRPTLV